MIIHGLLTVIVIATIAAGAVITGPTTTRIPQESNYVDATHSTPIDTMTTVQPAELPLITCFCNLPECLAPAGGDGICSTRLGCFAEVRTVLPEMEESVKLTGFTATESAITVNGSAVFPTIPEIIETETTPQVSEPSSERGSYGCLDLLHYSKQPCDEILKSMESDASEFPIIQAPTNGAQPSNDALVFAFHCCQTPKCNGNQSGPAEGSVKSAQAVLVAAFKSSLALNGDLKSKIENNSTEEVEIDPLAKLAAKYGVTSTHLNKEMIVLETGPAVIALGEPKPPSALKSESSEDAEIGSTTPAVPAAMPPILPEAVPVQQEMLLNDTVTNLKHFIAKRHDSQRVPPILKQTTDDQENIGEFDDDIAAEMAAATATAKSLPMYDQKNSGSPRHGGVPDFVPPPVLQKDKESYSSPNNYLDEDSDITNWMIGITCAIAVACIVGLSLLILSAFRIMRRSDIFRNYQSVCSNPGRPCACTGGLMRRPSYSQLDVAAAAVHRTSTTAPLLPPPNPGHKSRRGGGHANAGASYSDATGDTTYVMTHIPNNAVPLIPVVRR